MTSPDTHERIEAKAKSIPPRYRSRYLKAMGGGSLRAGVDAFCAECMGWEDLPDSVRDCTAPLCPLFPYRPYCPKYRKVELSKEEVERRRERARRLNYTRISRSQKREDGQPDAQGKP